MNWLQFLTLSFLSARLYDKNWSRPNLKLLFCFISYRFQEKHVIHSSCCLFDTVILPCNNNACLQITFNCSLCIGVWFNTLSVLGLFVISTKHGPSEVYQCHKPTCSPRQILCRLEYLKAYHRFHKNSPLDPVLWQSYPFRTITHRLRYTLILFFHVHVGLEKCFYFAGFFCVRFTLCCAHTRSIHHSSVDLVTPTAAIGCFVKSAN